MQSSGQTSDALKLGEVIEALCELGSAIAPDPRMAADLATHRLERVLLRGENVRLTADLTELARELARSTSTALGRKLRAARQASRHDRRAA